MTDIRDHELDAFFAHVVHLLEQLEIPYMVVGGFAATTYGQPRLTIDVDIVADMHLGHVRPFVAAFPEPDYYVSEDSVRDSLVRRYPFSVIDSNTAAKVDVVPMPRDSFTLAAFERRQRIVYDPQGHSAVFIAAEDIVVAKLLAHHATGSEKHLRDAQGVVMMRWESLDMESIRRTCQGAGVADLFAMVLETVRRDMEGDSD